MKRIHRYGVVSDPSGNIWMGAEYVSGVEHDSFANWATYLSRVTP